MNLCVSTGLSVILDHVMSIALLPFIFNHFQWTESHLELEVLKNAEKPVNNDHLSHLEFIIMIPEHLR
jgi:hypothetical protein